MQCDACMCCDLTMHGKWQLSEKKYCIGMYFDKKKPDQQQLNLSWCDPVSADGDQFETEELVKFTVYDRWAKVDHPEGRFTCKLLKPRFVPAELRVELIQHQSKSVWKQKKEKNPY